MRTTLTLESDVAAEAKAVAKRTGKPFKQVINEAMRLGFQQMQKPARRKPYRTRSQRMGLREGMNLDNIGDLLAQVEGEVYK